MLSPGRGAVSSQSGTLAPAGRRPVGERTIRPGGHSISAGPSLAPGDANLLLDLGNAFAGLTNYDAAADCYRQALNKEPANAGLHYNLGTVLGLQGNPEAERQELTEALRLKPDFSAAMQQLMVLQLRHTN